MSDTARRSGVQRVALVSLLWAIVVAGTKLGVGIKVGSVALLGDGLHSAIDVGATALTLGAVRWSTLPPDREHPYGHGRAENLAALGEAVLMVVVAVFVAAEALRRLRSGVVFEPPPIAIVVVIGAVIVDATRAAALRRAAKRYASPALEADALNFTADIGESAAVLVGLTAARFGLSAGDPVAAIVVSVVMVAMAIRVGRSATQVLMDRTPEDISDRIAAAVGDVAGVDEVRDLRVRRSGPDTHADLTVTVSRTESVERSHEITEEVEAAVSSAMPRATATVHVEPSQTGEDIVSRTFAAANRLGMADQIHNILVVHHAEGLWLMLHAKVDPDTPLARAHEVTDALEAELRLEIAGLARVEIHLEPREPRSLSGVVVTAHRERLTRDVRRIAEAHDPITRCHEVAVSEADDGLHLVLHCEAPPDTPISAIHDASLGAEAHIHDRFPEVRTVTVHFEPSAGL